MTVTRLVAVLVVILAAAGVYFLMLRQAPDSVPDASVESSAFTVGDPEFVLVMVLDGGEVRINLRPDLAPKHVERLKVLTRQGFYDGIVFHRVIDGFMAQTGDPTGTGSGGSDLPDLAAEFSEAAFKRGVLGMARTADPNSANSQFFITYADASHLNGQYTVFGEVAEGMDLVDKIKKGSPAQNGLVADPDKIIRMRVAADNQ